MARAIGLLFAGLWSVLAALSLPANWRVPALAAGGLATAILLIRLWLTPGATASRLFTRRSYIVAVLFEVAAIYAASALLPRVGLQGEFIQAVGFIVGLHFIGLWRATRQTKHLQTCAGLCLVAATTAPLPAELGGVELRNLATSLMSAIVLWAQASRPTE